MEGRRVPIAVLLAVAAIVVLLLGDPARTRFAPARDEGRAPAAALAPEGVRSAAWYCAFATADALPHTDDAAIITNLGGRTVSVAVTATAAGRVTSQRRVSLAGYSTVTLQAGDIGASAGAGVLIEPFGSDVVVDHHTSDAAGSVSQTPCATRASTDWYLPAGSTQRGTIERLALFNPFTQAAVVDVSALESDGTTRPTALQGVSVGPRSRAVININGAADQRAALAVVVHAEHGARLVAEVAVERHDTRGDGGFTVALGSPGLGRDWRVAMDSRVTATPTVAIVNPGASDVTVSVQTIAGGFGRASERFIKVSAGTAMVVGVPIPVGRPEVTVAVSSRTPSIAVAGFVTYQGKRGRAGPISIVTGATLDARRSAFATPGPGSTRTVTLVLENDSSGVASVNVAVANAGNIKATVARDSLTALTMGFTAQTSPLVITANEPVYTFRRIDEGTGVSTAPAVPAG